MPHVQFPAWGTTARVEVGHARALGPAARLATRVLAAAERACDPLHPGAEVHRLTRAGGRPVRVGTVLAAVLAEAIEASRRTGGAFDPTVAVAPAARGGRDLTLLPWCGGLPVAVRRAAPGVAGIRLDGRTASVPAGVALDLAGIATAVSARWAADLVARTCGVDVLVEVGGDVAVAGPGRTWRLLGDGRAAGAVLPPGSSLSAVARDAVVDPQTGAVPPGPWSAAVVVHPSCATAKALAVAALVRGADAPRWLDGLGASARLLRDGGPEVDVQGDGSARRGPALAEVSGS